MSAPSSRRSGAPNISGFCSVGPLEGHQYCKLKDCICTKCGHGDDKEKDE